MTKEFSIKMNKSKVDIAEEKQKVNSAETKFAEDSQETKASGSSVKIEIPPKTIITVLLVIVGIYLLVQLVNVFIILFFAFVVASATLPLISNMTKKGLPRWLSITVVYFLMIAILFALVSVIISPLISETGKIARELTTMSEQSLESLEDFRFELLGIYGSELKIQLSDYIESFAKEIVPSLFGSTGTVSTAVDAAMGVGGSLIVFFSIILFSVYMVADHDRVVDSILIRVHDDEKRDRIRKLIVDVEYKLGRWLVGQGTVSLIIGLITWSILTIFGVPFALPLAVLAALLEIIPNIGPVLVSIPIFLIALLSQGIFVAVLVLLSYIVLQQFQSYFLTPRIMSEVIGLHPLSILIGMLVGFTLFGIIGAVLAIPSLVLLKIGYEFYKDLQKLKAKGIL